MVLGAIGAILMLVMARTRRSGKCECGEVAWELMWRGNRPRDSNKSSTTVELEVDDRCEDTGTQGVEDTK
jgi:hypothetical protein